jgi:hypothetical protein
MGGNFLWHAAGDVRAARLPILLKAFLIGGRLLGVPGWPDSPIGQLFTLGGSLKITKVDQILGLLIFHGARHVLIFRYKTGLGYIFGPFFTNSSGHPVGYARFTPTRLRLFDPFLDAKVGTALFGSLREVGWLNCMLEANKKIWSIWSPWFFYSVST